MDAAKSPHAHLFPAIHASRRKIAGLEDEATWRSWLRQATGKDSLRAMDGAELGHVLDLLNAGAGARPPKIGGRPVVAKARALWFSLYNLGLVGNPHDKALAAFVRRQAAVDDPAWLTADQADTVIEALKAMAARAGYEAKRFDAAGATPLQGSFKPGLIEAQWRRLVALGAFDSGQFATLGAWLAREGYGVAAPQFLGDQQASAVIRDLGAWIRRLAKAKAPA